MAQELKELCQLLFPDSTTENAEYFSDVTEYIKKLGSLNWEHVKKEPERLNEDMKHLTEQTQELAFTNYKTFVETADISRAIMKDLGKSKESLASFLNNIPDFESQCESFSQVAGGIVQEKRRYSTIRNQSDKLLELLELPSLMREALNAEDYESALDIFAFIRNLSKRYSEIPIVEITNTNGGILCVECFTLIQARATSEVVPTPEFGHQQVCLSCGISILRARTYRVSAECPERNILLRFTPVHQSTTSEIMTLWYETLYHLFNQLHYDLPLPQCLQILGYLRRANTVFKSTEDEHNRLQSISNKSSFTSDGLHLHFLKARNAWFEKALEDARNTEAPEKMLRKIVELHRIHLFNVITQHKSIFLSDAQESKVRDNELNGTSALSCWLKLKVESLANILNQDLWREDETGFESIMNQCMYLCLSFGRVGADLRCVLTPLFRNNVLMQFNCGMEKVDNQFENQMKSYKVPSIKNVSRPLNENMASGPPENLLDYYPLAEYCNGMLTVLNSLRVTAPLNIVKDVYRGFKKSFDKAAQILITFYQREQQAFTDIEKQNFVSFCVCFTEDLVPYIAKCLSQSFPPTQVAELLGITLTVLQESKILYLDQIEICKPLNSVTGLVLG